MNDLELGELLQNYKEGIIRLVAIKEELVRRGFLPPTLVIETDAFIGTAELDTQGGFPRLVAESKARHQSKEQ